MRRASSVGLSSRSWTSEYLKENRAMASKPPTAEASIKLHQLPPASMLTASEASVFLGISESTLARMRRDGIGPPYVKGGGSNGAIQYRKQDLQDWLAAVKTGGKVR